MTFLPQAWKTVLSLLECLRIRQPIFLLMAPPLPSFRSARGPPNHDSISCTVTSSAADPRPPPNYYSVSCAATSSTIALYLPQPTDLPKKVTSTDNHTLNYGIAARPSSSPIMFNLFSQLYFSLLQKTTNINQFKKRNPANFEIPQMSEISHMFSTYSAFVACLVVQIQRLWMNKKVLVS